MKRMDLRRVGFLCGMLLVMFFCAQTGVGQDQAGTPRAVFEEPEYDFGSVYAGKNVVHEFVIKNIGDAPLVIESVKTG